MESLANPIEGSFRCDVAFPNADHNPAVAAKLPRNAAIPLSVRFDLVVPKGRIGSRKIYELYYI
jgi:hypothetical protein